MKKKFPKRRNGIAKALESPTHRPRVIPDKRQKDEDAYQESIRAFREFEWPKKSSGRKK